MNALFLCQAQTLDLFYDLFIHLRSKKKVEKACFVISDSNHYKKFLASHPSFESEGHLILKEWEINQTSENAKPNYELIDSFQKRFPSSNLWPPIIADRRIMWGPNFTFRQDYKSQHSDEEIHSILSTSLYEMDRVMREFKPDFMVSFICTTLLEYLADYFSRDAKIPFLNLRATRVENYMHFAPSVEEPSKVLKDTYKNLNLDLVSQSELLMKTENFLEETKKSIIKYEGVFLPNQRPPQSKFALPKLKKIFVNIKEMLKQEYDFRFRFIKTDRHLPGFIKPIIYRIILNPIMVKRINHYLMGLYVTKDQLGTMDYAFFPLHIEPEVTLLVYARNFTNQIEVVRSIALNLPVGMNLIVKEHPAAVGKRPISYYKKLLEIPNVRLIAPNMETKEIIDSAKLITTISGSVGFEGALMKKPVLLIGHAPYEILPDNMVKRAGDYDKLSECINQLMNDYKYNETAMKTFIYSIMETSVPIDFYTTLLKRKEQLAFSDNADYEEEISKLGEYTIRMVNNIKRGKYEI
tara:strand:+ start:2596 stop:4164 length:1569 start_codon:yes stop_codon:yes gene_type:complete